MRHKLQQMNRREMMVAGTIRIAFAGYSLLFPIWDSRKVSRRKSVRDYPSLRCRLSRGRI